MWPSSHVLGSRSSLLLHKTRAGPPIGGPAFRSDAKDGYFTSIMVLTEENFSPFSPVAIRR